MDSRGGDEESGKKIDHEPQMHIKADLSNKKFRGQPPVHDSCDMYNGVWQYKKLEYQKLNFCVTLSSQ